jgi:predicted GIY-YIG superfamily endonuclease
LRELQGGVGGTRTRYLVVANVALSRLSYCPVEVAVTLTTEWWVYVIQSQAPRFNKKGERLPGFYYVGSTTDYRRRLRQHNGEVKGGGKYTAQHRPWLPAALYGPYDSRSEALKAELMLKRTKRSTNRTKWSSRDSDLCRGLGANDPWVTGAEAEEILEAAAPSVPRRRYASRRRRRR